MINLKEFRLPIKPRVLLVIIPLILFAALSLFFRDRLSSSGVLMPYSSETQTQALKNLLVDKNLSLNGAPLIVDSTITASVSGYQVLFSSKKPLESQVQALQLVLGKIKMNDKKPTEIDLRFNKVVLKY